MELSYIFYQLKHAGIDLWTAECLSDCPVRMFQLYTPEVRTARDILYIATDEQVSFPGNLPDAGAFLIVSPRDCSSTFPDSVVVKPIVVSELVNFLSDLFSSYQSMCLAAKDREPDLFSLMNQIEKTLGIPATLIGGNMTGIAYSVGVGAMRFVNDEAESASIQSQIIWDKEFFDTQETRDVFLYENHLLEEQVTLMLCYNIFVRNRFQARFALLYKDEWRTEYLRPVVRMLGQELSAYFSASPERGRAMQKTVAFYEAMGRVVSGARMEDILDLNQFGWYADQEYRIYVFRFDARFPMKVSREYLQNKLEEFLGECFITDRQGEIICVCNRSISGFTFTESRERLVAFLMEHICKVGISNCFRDLFETPRYINQAQWAMKLGHQKNPMHWYHHFRDYTYEYILEQSIREFPVEEIVMPELFALLERDREKGSALFETLELYIRNKCNGQATAKQLFIHRTTFLYRMKQIEELTHLDIQNEQVYKRLLISFELYRRKNQ